MFCVWAGCWLWVCSQGCGISAGAYRQQQQQPKHYAVLRRTAHGLSLPYTWPACLKAVVLKYTLPLDSYAMPLAMMAWM